MRMLLTLLVLPVLAQQGVTVRGTVVNSVTQEPLNNAIVTLSFAGGRGGTSFVTESSGGGKFAIQGMTPGKYMIMAQRDGYTKEVDGAPGAPPPQILLEIGKDLNVVVRMQPLCVISGRVTDADGDPLRGVNVMAIRYGYVAGKRVLNSMSSVMTDDRGDYRLFSLVPGKYYVRAGGNPRGPSTYTHAINAVTFFPGTTEVAEASTVNVSAGGEARGIDIALRMEAVFKVRGTMPAGTSVQLTSLSPQATGGSFSGGDFGNQEGHSFCARQNIVVGGADVDGVNLTFLPASDVAGKVVWDGAPTGKFEGMRVRLRPPAGTRGGAVPLAPLKEDGTFVLHDVPPQLFELMINGPAASYLKSVQVGGKAMDGREVDLTKGGNTLTVVLASDFGGVDGTVKDENGVPAVRVRVTAIPVGRNLGRMDDSRFAFTDDNGNFKIAKLAPGDYKMFAWDKVVVGAPQDPEFRKPYEKQGLEIRLESNGHKTAVLTLIHVAEP